MRKPKYNPKREISLFPEYEEEYRKAEAEKINNRIREQIEKAIFDDIQNATRRAAEDAQRCTCPGKIISILTIDR